MKMPAHVGPLRTYFKVLIFVYRKRLSTFDVLTHKLTRYPWEMMGKHIHYVESLEELPGYFRQFAYMNGGPYDWEFGHKLLGTEMRHTSHKLDRPNNPDSFGACKKCGNPKTDLFQSKWCNDCRPKPLYEA